MILQHRLNCEKDGSKHNLKFNKNENEAFVFETS